MRSAIFSLIFIIVSSAYSADRIAIYDFGHDEDVSVNEAKAFTDKVTNAFMGYAQFEVMNREKFEAILEEQQIQLSGLCDEDCIVEVGQIAGVQYMVSGDVRTLGNSLFLVAQIIDVETSKLMASKDLIVESTNVGALLKAAPELADALMQQFVEKKGLTAGGFNTILDESELGKLKLNVSEGGVQLVIDGRSRGVISRKEIIIQLPPGQHDVEIHKEGFNSYSTTIAVQYNSTVTKEINLIASGTQVEEVIDWGFVTIATQPNQANVAIDGVEYGTTFFNDKIAPGKHTIVLSKPLYYNVVKEIELEPGSLLPLELSLKPNFGSLTVTSNPPGATISVNGRQELTKTPHTIQHLKSGSHTLNLTFPDYREYEREISISDEVDTKIDAALTPAFGWLSVNTNPEGATILLDNREIGKAPLVEYRIPSGEYLMTIKTQYYKDYEELITISDNSKQMQDVALYPNFGRISVQGNPPGAKILIDGKARGVVPSIIEPVAVGSHTIKIDAGKHYKQFEQSIYIPLNDMVGVQANLKELYGSLITSSNPPGALVEVNGKLEKTSSGNNAVTPYVIPKLWTGMNEITFRLDGFAPSTHSVFIEEDKREVVQADLQRLVYIKSRGQALWRSAVFPGAGQFYEERYGYGIMYTAANVSLAYYILQLRAEYSILHNNYMTKRSLYRSYSGTASELEVLWDDVEHAYTQTEDNHSKQLMAVGALACAYAWNILDAWLFMPKRTENNWSAQISRDNGAIVARLEVSIP